jgi:c-di-GMP-binding flagellar brake protein YcgR
MPNSHDTENHNELLQADNFSQYILHDSREIAFVLRQLAAKRALVSALFGEIGQDFLLTSILSVAEDNSSVLIDLVRDPAIVSRALSYGRLLCDTQLDKVKVQFPLENLKVTEHEGHPALRASLPDALLRLQRREYFRFSVPVTGDMLCTIPLPDGKTTSVRIIDISGGGIALVVSPDSSLFAPGIVFNECTMTLPGTTTPVKFSLEVRNLFRITLRDERELLRAGCVFTNMPMQVANQIQRFIMRAEQERASRGTS